MNRGSLIYSKARTLVTPVQTLLGIRHRCPAVLKDPICKSICWVGVFGSFSRNQQKRTSTIDVIVGLNEIGNSTSDWGCASDRYMSRARKLFGRKVDALELLTRDPDSSDLANYYLLEGLLTCVTVYGPEDWHHRARENARLILDKGYRHLWKIDHIMSYIEKALEMTNKNQFLFSHEHRAPILGSLICLVDCLNFNNLEPFQGLCDPISGWMLSEQINLQRLISLPSGLQPSELESLWDIMTTVLHEFREFWPDHIAIVKATYKEAGIQIPEVS